MVKNVRDFVEGIGISESLPENPKYFKEITVHETLEIPQQKPDIEQLLSVIVDPEIISIRVIDTPVALSNEGQYLSGCKLVVELLLKQKIKYIADEESQPVHAAEYTKAVSSIFIVVPCEINGISLHELLRKNRIIVTPYIEDIYGVMKDKRTVFKNIAILIDVTFRMSDCL